MMRQSGTMMRLTTRNREATQQPDLDALDDACADMVRTLGHCMHKVESKNAAESSIGSVDDDEECATGKAQENLKNNQVHLRSTMIRSNFDSFCFVSFTTLVRFMQDNKFKRGQLTLLYLTAIFGLLVVSYILVNEVTDVHELKHVGITISVLVLLSGLPQLLLLFAGLPIIIHKGILFVMVLDVVMWMATLGLSIAAICLTTHASIYAAKSASLFYAIRLNTFLAASNAIDGLLAKRNLGENKVCVPIEKLITVIQDSSIPTRHKNVLVGRVDAFCNSKDVRELGQDDFVLLLLRILPDIAQWKVQDSLKRSEEAHDELLAKLDFVALSDSVDVGEKEARTVPDTVLMVWRLLSESQLLLSCTVCVCLVLGAVTLPAFNLLVGDLVNLGDSLSNGDGSVRSSFNQGLVGVSMLYLVNEGLFYASSYISSRLYANAAARIQCELASAVLYTGSTFEEGFRPAALSGAFSSGLTNVQLVWDLVLFDLILSVASLIAAFVFLALFDFAYTVYVLTALPLIFSFSGLEGKALDCSEASDASNARLLSRFQNAISLRRAAKVNNARKFVMGGMKSALEEAKKDNFATWLWSHIVIALYSTIGYTLNVVTTLVFLLSLASGKINSGEFFSLVAFMQSVIEPIEALGRFSGQVTQMSGSIHMIRAVLDSAAKDTQPAEDKGGDQGPVTLDLHSQLVLQDVKFSYRPGSSPLALKGVSARIPAGSYAALLGPSGSGKSTILSLLMGVQAITEGSILMDDTDISSVSVGVLRNSLGVVFQDTYVYDGSIRENIAFGADVGMEEIIQAAQDARVHDFILTLPDQYDTVIGKETSLTLSGGQLQRICGIARALIRKPKLLLLDEATSALDPITERDFIETIERLRDGGLTTVSVTHHPVTAVNADIILVLKDGVIVETGTNDELLAQEGLYAELAKASY